MRNKFNVESVRRQKFSRKARGQKNFERKKKSAAGEKIRDICNALYKRCKLTKRVQKLLHRRNFLLKGSKYNVILGQY